MQLETKRVGQPVDGFARAPSQDLDEVITSEISRRLLCVVKEDLSRIGKGQAHSKYIASMAGCQACQRSNSTHLSTVWNTLLSLVCCAGSVDTRCCLGRVATKEGVLRMPVQFVVSAEPIVEGQATTGNFRLTLSRTRTLPPRW